VPAGPWVAMHARARPRRCKRAREGGTAVGHRPVLVAEVGDEGLVVRDGDDAALQAKPGGAVTLPGAVCTFVSY
jgi:hypothetical protein